MKKVTILYYPLRPLMDIATVISDILTSNGIQNTITSVYHQIWDRNDDLYLIIWNGITVYPKNCIIFNFDPMSASHVYGQFTTQLANSDTKIKLLVDYCSGLNETIFTRLMSLNPEKFPRKRYEMIPFGYSYYYERIYNDCVPVKPVKKDIDVLFYGGNNDRRSSVINSIFQLCATKEKKFIFRNQDLYLKHEKAQLISRSRIVLSIASQDALNSATNDLARLSYLISNKIFVIAERIGDKKVEDVLSQYINYSYNVEEFLSKINYFLNDTPEINQEIEDNVNNAYERFKEDFNYDKEMKRTVIPIIIDHVYKEVLEDSKKLVENFPLL